METFALYLFKSAIWLSGFALVYFLFLRNERFFMLKRVYLISGILISLIFPFISVHYQVELPVPDVNPVDFTPAGNSILTAVQQISTGKPFDYRNILMVLYLAGVLFFAFRLIWHIRSLYRTINKANINKHGSANLIRTYEFSTSFSFFNYVFVNPSVNETEMEEIMNHELVHVRQKHWFDLLFVELLSLLQWVNPFMWIYTGFIRLNHEYLADEAALQRTSDPAIYKAALLNQMFMSPVISLSNSFNYSLNKKRFEMMKKIITSPYRKIKILLILPVFAIVFYAFATPEYNYTTPSDNTMAIYQSQAIISKEIKGRVLDQDGKPLQGAAIVVKGTTLGVSSDAKGFFRLSNMPDEAMLVVSYIGFTSEVIKPDFTSEMTVQMKRHIVGTETVNINPPPPPPPPLPAGTGFKIRSTETPPPPHPLFVVDGVIMDNFEINKIDKETIESVSILKDNFSTEKYGEKGKNGVVEIKTKKDDSEGNEKKKSDIEVTGYGVQKADKDNFVAIEEMPVFPGGDQVMLNWISQNVKYPAEAVQKKITGLVNVNFVVSSTGKVKNIQVKKSVNPLLDAEAIWVISNMPDWKPGRQNGKPVDVDYMIPVEFKLQ